MVKKNKGILPADAAQKIYSKYYKNRKQGEDALTDDAYHREMQSLLTKVEARKVELGIDNKSQQPQEGLMAARNGGNLPNPPRTSQYQNINYSNPPLMDNRFGRTDPYAGVNWQSYHEERQAHAIPSFRQNMTHDINISPMALGEESIIPDEADLYAAERGNTVTQKMNPISAQPQIEAQIQTPETTEITAPEVEGSSPSYNIGASAIGLGANLLGNVASSALNAKAANRTYESMKKINKRTPIEKIRHDNSREIAGIKANQALTESTVRQNTRGLGNSFAATQLANLGRVQGSRVSGNQQSASHTRNDQLNKQSQSEERRLKIADSQRVRDADLRIESKKHDPQRIYADGISKSAQSIANYSAEDQRVKRDDAYLNMIASNYGTSYAKSYQNMTPTQKRLARMRLITPSMNKVINNGRSV